MARSTQRPWSLFRRGGESDPTIRRACRRSPLDRVLRFEPLEDRRLLATVTVGNLNDVVNGTVTSIAALVATPGADGISLREAIIAANADAAADVIDFAPSVTGTIQLTNAGHAGEIAINTALSINGPGAGMLTVRAFAGTAAVGDGARIFNVTNFFFNTLTIGISGLTLTGGDAAGNGGAIESAENLTLTACTISGNRAGNQGGGVANVSGGNLSITLSTISGNTAAGPGGGVHSNLGSLTIARSTISGNVVGNGTSFNGGGVHSSESPTTIDSSTISGNSAGGSGGISSDNASLTITNSTISGNSARGGAGGIFFGGSGLLTLRHSTVTLNRSDSANSSGGTGGGLSVSGSAVVEHSIVAGNLRGTGAARDDISGAVTPRYCLIGDNTGATITNNGGNQIGTGAAPIDPLLGSLVNNGGTTLTHSPKPASPAIDAGDTAVVAGVGTAPLFDQRGASLVRVFDGDIAGGARIDIGAVEYQSIFVVDTLVDEFDGNLTAGDLSLREALNLANATSDDSIITFAHAMTDAGPATILLTQGELAIRSSMTIQGPGANLLTISGNNASRIFNINVVLAGGSVVLEDLTITNGFNDLGGAMRADNPNNQALTLRRCAITNSTGTFGGAIFIIGGSTLIEECTLSGNSAIASVNSPGVGGAISLFDNGLLTIRRSTLSGNTAAFQGGAIDCYDDVSLIIEDSTLSGNTAYTSNSTDPFSGGGALHTFGNTNVVISNCTLSGNSAPTSRGGAIFMLLIDFPDKSEFEIRNSTITGNSAGVAGGGIAHLFQPGVVSLNNTILAGNTNADTPDFSSNLSPTLNVGGNNNLIGVAGGGNFTLTGTGNLSGTLAAPLNPMLGALANNGGPTKTHALLTGSPAIDAGDPAAVAGVGGVPLFDQRGAPFVRVFDGDNAGGARIDIGSYEVQTTVAASADFDSDGDTDGGDFLAWQRGLGLTGAAATKANGNADGDMDVDGADLAVWRNTFGASGVAAARGQVSPKLANSEVSEKLPCATALAPDLVDAAMAYKQILDQIATEGAGRKRFLRAK